MNENKPIHDKGSDALKQEINEYLDDKDRST